MKVLATLKDGTTVESEFEKLTGIRKLSADVFAGRKAFPVWRTVADHLPSGEPCLLRTREFINGSEIVGLVVVDENGEPEVHVMGGRYGVFTVTEEFAAENGLEVGAKYPIHRDEEFRRYIYTAWSENEVERVKAYLDPEPVAAAPSRDWDEEQGWDGFEDDDDL